MVNVGPAAHNSMHEANHTDFVKRISTLHALLQSARGAADSRALRQSLSASTTSLPPRPPRHPHSLRQSQSSLNGLSRLEEEGAEAPAWAGDELAGDVRCSVSSLPLVSVLPGGKQAGECVPLVVLPCCQSARYGICLFSGFLCWPGISCMASDPCAFFLQVFMPAMELPLISDTQLQCQ